MLSKCHKKNSIVMFADGFLTSCINNYVNNLNNEICSLYSQECDLCNKHVSELIFIISNQCNYNCKYCADSYYRNLFQKHTRIYNKDMVLKQIKELNVSTIHFSYFEPLFNVSLLKTIITDISELNTIKKIIITTDGNNLTQSFLDFLSNINIKFIISVNINIPDEIHNKYKSKYSILINNVGNLYKPNNVNIELECVIFKELFGKELMFIKELCLISDYFDRINLVYNHYDIPFYKVNYSIILLTAYKKLNISNEKIKIAITNLKNKYTLTFIKNNVYYNQVFEYYNNNSEKYIEQNISCVK